jgi:hypothetical protein
MKNESMPGTGKIFEPPRARWVAPAVAKLGTLADLTLEFGSEGGAECDPETGIGCGPE